MSTTILLATFLVLTTVAFELGRRRALQVSGGQFRQLHSVPRYYGTFTAMWCGIPALVVLSLWMALEQSIVTHLVIADLPSELRSLPEAQLDLLINEVRNHLSGNIVPGGLDPALQAAADHYRHLSSVSHAARTVVFLCVALIGLLFAYRKISPTFWARNRVEQIVKGLLIACSTIAIFTTIGIVLSVLFESIRFFQTVSVFDFLFGLEWSPQTAIRDDQVGSSGAFGAVPLFAGTMLISLIAMLVAVPIGLLSAIYLSEYATPRIRAVAKPALEILAGVPTVVYGFFAALTVAPLIRGWGTMVGLDVSSESALAAGLVMGIMIIPFVSSLSDDVINAVPQALRDGSLALGATQSETVKKVVLPAALPGIVGGILLAVSRAIGETMI
ncbi:MAG: phosphate ABC transporter permease subunit PstC, partial [Gammaproteobacteria bacterium]|nr:phosphate ABC transporter permease subunit PstC [Gammaproteobacteria bacterium]